MTGALAGLVHMQLMDALIHREQVGLVSSHLIFRLLHVTQASDRPKLTILSLSTPADWQLAFWRRKSSRYSRQEIFDSS